MNHIKFNRHQIFDAFLMEFHSTTISRVRNDNKTLKDNKHEQLVNMLNGIWDGYLYNDILLNAEILPVEDFRRVEDIVTIIKNKVK